MATPTVAAGTAFNLTATGNVGVANDNCTLIGFYVNSTSSGTLVLRRGGASGTVMCGTITPAVGWNSFPVTCPSGLHATITGTLDVTFSVVCGQ
jgi:hypothetical protein